MRWVGVPWARLGLAVVAAAAATQLAALASAMAALPPLVPAEAQATERIIKSEDIIELVILPFKVTAVEIPLQAATEFAEL